MKSADVKMVICEPITNLNRTSFETLVETADLWSASHAKRQTMQETILTAVDYDTTCDADDDSHANNSCMRCRKKEKI